jgi:cell division septal protein FtsQ
MSLFGAYSAKKHLPFDYQQKKLENPFFKRRERIVSFAGLKAKLAIAAIVLISALLIWFFLFSAFWKIKEISLAGLDQATETEVRQLIAEQMKLKKYLLFPQNNLLFFNEKKFQETIKGKYRFQKISLEKKWPAKLIVAITEKPIAGVWNEADKYYYVDVDGYLVQEINPLDIQDKKYPLIANQSSDLARDLKIQADPALLAAAARLFEKIPQKSLGISASRFIIDNEIDTVKVQTAEGPLISFDAKGDIDRQLNRLFTLKTQKLKDDFTEKKTIDLRFGDKIYYQ